MFFRFDISASGLLQDKKEYVEPLFTENKYAGLVYVAMLWLDISALGSKYFTYSSYKSCIVSEKYYLCTVLIQPKAPMGRGWADIMVKGVFVRFGFDELESRKFIDKSKTKQQRTPHEVYDMQLLLTSIKSGVVKRLTLVWGFRRCSFRLVGQCESLNS